MASWQPPLTTYLGEAAEMCLLLKEPLVNTFLFPHLEQTQPDTQHLLHSSTGSEYSLGILIMVFIGER